MAGPSPRLSGSGVQLEDVMTCGDSRSFDLTSRPLQSQLRRIRFWIWCKVQQTVDTSSVHQVGAHQPGESERRLHRRLSGLGKTQQQESNQRHGDLDADGVFAGSEKMADLQGLLDPAEEQLDRPAALVEIGDLLCRRLQIVAQDAQNLAAVELDPHLAHRLAERVAPGLGVDLAGRQMAHPIGQHAAACRNRTVTGSSERGIGFEAGHNPAARRIQLGPPAVIVIAEIEDVSRAGLDRHFLSRRDVPRVKPEGRLLTLAALTTA